jgi:hypothetical protein
MAKHCEHCNRDYPDELESCPHCAAVEGEALLVDDDALQTQADLILPDEGAEGPAAPPHPESEPVLDVADVHVLRQEPGEASDVALAGEPPSGEGSEVPLGREPPLAEAVSDVALASGSEVGIGREPRPRPEAVSDVALASGTSGVSLGNEPRPPAEALSDVALAAAEPPPPDGVASATTEAYLDVSKAAPPPEPATSEAVAVGEEEPIMAAPDSAVDLGEAVEVVADASGVQPASDVSDTGWAELVAAEEEVGPGAGEVVVDAPSDKDLLHATAEEEPIPVGEAEEGGDDLEKFSTLRPEQLPTQPAVPGAETGVPSMELEEPEVVAEAEEEGEEVVFPAEAEEVIDLGAAEAEPTSAVDLLGGEQPVSRGELDLVSGAMEPEPSGVHPAGGQHLGGPGVEEAIDLTEVGAEAGGGDASGVDLSSATAPGQGGSSVDLTGTGAAAAAAGSGSGLDLHALGETAPAAEGEAAEEWPTEHLSEAEGMEETVAYEGPPSARDIVEQVESGVDLGHEAAAAEDVEETINLESAPSAGEDSAIDLGAPMAEEQAEAAPAAAAGGDSDLLMEAMEEEATAAGAEEPVATEEAATEAGGEAAVAEEEPVGVADTEAGEEVAEEEPVAAGAGAAPARGRSGALP